jgi:transcriptional regulator with XRE-family HTH domain
MSASEIDAYVGNRMRQRREAMGISQGRLGRHLGLTFSQIQKYEKGSNRIGAGRLYHIADFLGVPPSHFFEGLHGAAGSERGPGPHEEEIKTLMEAFLDIRDAETRASVLALVRSLTPAARVRRNNSERNRDGGR